MTTEHTVEETHLADEGLWIPPELREFTAQIVFRTPKATIQHFQSGGGQLDGYYGMIDERDFGDHEEMRDPQNPELAPNKVSIKPQEEDAVVLEVDLEPDLLADGGVDGCAGDTERCPICDEPLRDSDDTEYWGEVKEVHAECNPGTQIGWSP